MMQHFRPLNGTVLVLRDEQAKEERLESGLYKPQSTIELSNQGEVRAVAEGSKLNIGDRVVFTKYAGSTIELNGVEYLLLKEEKEVQGTVTEVAIA